MIKNPHNLIRFVDGGASIWVPAIATTLSAGAGVAGSAISAGAKWGSSTYLRVAKEMARYNQAQSEDIYNRYQSPSAIMRQYKEAGLNPNLVYQGAGAGSSPSPGQVSTNPSDYESTKGQDRAQMIASLGGIIGMYQDLRAKQGQIDQTTATTDAIRIRSELDAARGEAQRIQNDFQRSKNAYTLEGLETKNARAALALEYDTKYGAEKIIAGLELTRSKIANSKMDIQVKEKQLDEIDTRISKMRQEIKESEDRIKGYQFMRSLEFSRFAEEKKNNAIHRIGQMMSIKRAGLDYVGALYDQAERRSNRWVRNAQGQAAFAKAMSDYYYDSGLPMPARGETGYFARGVDRMVRSYIPFVSKR